MYKEINKLAGLLIGGAKSATADPHTGVIYPNPVGFFVSNADSCCSYRVPELDVALEPCIVSLVTSYKKKLKVTSYVIHKFTWNLVFTSLSEFSLELKLY